LGILVFRLAFSCFVSFRVGEFALQQRFKSDEQVKD
jgi:hypothetical protein